VSSTAFTIVKWTGAAYLIVLGVQAIRGRTTLSQKEKPRLIPAKSVLRDGFAIALLNPKTTIFFAAFLPQFMTNDSNPTLQAIFLSTLCIAIAAVTDSIYAIIASSASDWLSRSVFAGRGGRFLNGGVFRCLYRRRWRSQRELSGVIVTDEVACAENPNGNSWPTDVGPEDATGALLN